MIEQGEPLYWFIGMFLVFIFGLMIGATIFAPEKDHKKTD